MRAAASRIALKVPIRLIWIVRVKTSSGKGAPSLPTVRDALPMPGAVDQRAQRAEGGDRRVERGRRAAPRR